MQQGGAAYLRAKYPGLPTDAIAGKLCELAETYAAGGRWCLGCCGQCRRAYGRDGDPCGDQRGDGGKQLALPEEEVLRLAEKVDADLDGICVVLGSIQEAANRESVARCFCLIVAADGELQAAEQQVLGRLLEALGQQHLLEELPALAKRFRREDGAVDQALFAMGDGANWAGAKVGEAMGWAGKLFQKDKPANAEAPQVEFEASVKEKTNAMILAAMETLTQRFAAGEVSQVDYKSQFAVLTEQLQG